MCPACITTVAMVAAGASSTGGLAAVVARVFRRKRHVAQSAPKQGASK
ncbi:MAG: hypothetical protein JWM53_743 [bacterium]|nr:hypothetical protein [bacterium]